MTNVPQCVECEQKLLLSWMEKHMVPMGVAAGWVKQPADIQKLSKVPLDILDSITFGSYTVEERSGNPGDTFFCDDSGSSVNSRGLPNPGIERACTFLPAMCEEVRATGKKVRISIAGFTVQDYLDQTRILLECGRFEVLEINFSCPNTKGEGHEDMFSSSTSLMSAVLQGVSELIAAGRFRPLVAAKISYYSVRHVRGDVIAFYKVAAQQGWVQELVNCNTAPDALFLDEIGTPRITPNNGLGGLAGAALHPLSLGQVYEFSRAIPELPVCGVGGVRDGATIRNMEHAGASSVQIGSAYFEHEDPHIFQSIAQDYLRTFVGNV